MSATTDDDDLEEIREVFLEEAEEHLQAMEEGLCQLWEGAREAELIHGLFRSAHSLKGGAGAFGLDALTLVTHQMETLFDHFRTGKLECTTELVDVLMAARDVLTQLVDAAKSHQPLDVGLAERTKATLCAAIGGEPAAASTDQGPNRAAAAAAAAAAGVGVEAPAADAPLQQREAGRSASGATPQAAKGATAAKRPGSASSVRVPTGKLDELVNTVGELVITQSSLEEIARSLPPEAAIDIRETLRVLARQMNDLRWQTLGLRMLPLESLFKRLPQVVRDTARVVQKDVEFVMQGQDIEVDKLVLEKLNDPLVHLLRNAVDHGLESNSTRVAKGKPEKGRITLSARRQAGRITVSVVDDGSGIPTDRVLEKARNAGIVGRDSELTKDQIHDLIFSPGLSTAAQVTGVSGRGVGLDVVRENVRALGGDITLRSGPTGTTFHISLPLSLEIIDAQLIRICDQIFVVPLSAAHGHVRYDSRRLHCLQGDMPAYRLTDGVVPLIDGARTFANRTRTVAPTVVVVLHGREQRFGLLADALVGQQPVVVRPLDANFRPVPGIAGATILGSGDLALILDAMSMDEIGDFPPLDLLREVA